MINQMKKSQMPNGAGMFCIKFPPMRDSTLIKSWGSPGGDDCSFLLLKRGYSLFCALVLLITKGGYLI